MSEEKKVYKIKDFNGEEKEFYEGEPVLVGYGEKCDMICFFFGLGDYGEIQAKCSFASLYLNICDNILKLHPTVPERWVINGEVYTKGEKIIIVNHEGEAHEDTFLFYCEGFPYPVIGKKDNYEECDIRKINSEDEVITINLGDGKKITDTKSKIKKYAEILNEITKEK